MFAKAVNKVIKTRAASDSFAASSDAAVATENKPGRLLEELGDSDTVRVSRALQQAVLGTTCTEYGSVIMHNEEIFTRIRHCFGRSEEQYQRALGQEPFHLLGEEEAAGKSRAFFVFTECGRYCLKSIDPSEASVVLRIIADYEQYVSVNKDTLLPKFFGLYEVCLTGTKTKIWMLVQGNVLGGRSGVIQRFDLKGSTFGRRASAKERAKGRGSVLKDLDFANDGCSICGVNEAAEQQWERFVRSMDSDAKWLASQNLLDYSLLLGFSSCPIEALKKPLTHIHRLRLAHSSLGSIGASLPETDALVVYVGIVDCLMPFSLRKRLENLVCGSLFNSDLSCQPPEVYASRFSNFVENLASSSELQALVARQQQGARRPLGFLASGGFEIGRKDVGRFLRNPLCVLLSGGIVVLAGFSWHRAKMR